MPETCKLLGVHPQQLYRWRTKGTGPAYIRMTEFGAIRYRRSVLNAFMLLRQRQTTRLPALSRGDLPSLKHALGRLPLAA